MKISQIFIPLLPFFLLLSTTVDSRPTPRITLPRRGVFETCIPLFGNCNNDQWSFNPFTSTPFLQDQEPPQNIVVPSPPPPQPTFFNPYFTPPSFNTNPTFSPLLASPPPPQFNNIPAPFFGFSYSPPVDYGNQTPETVNLPPIAERNAPDVFMSPPNVFMTPPGLYNVPPPPLVDIHSGTPQDTGEIPQLPPVAQSPPTD